MVFFDVTGTRKLYVVIGAALVAFLVLCSLGASLWALTTARTDPLLTYTSHSSDTQQYGKTIALTFDDGPDPVYTRQLLDLLQQEQVPATFFLIGEHVVRYPDVARDIVQRGFEIGNHTFTHSERVANEEVRLRSELIATDRVIRDVTGFQARLFRPPFLEDVNVGEFDGGKIGSTEVRWAEDAGFVVVGANLDTQDWNVVPGDSSTIVERVNERLKGDKPTVIIMHEHAGEGATIAAVRALIPAMKAQGYRFVPVSEYFGLSQNDIMIPAPTSSIRDTIVVGAAKALVSLNAWFNAFILLASILGLARLWVVLAGRRFIVPYWRRARAPKPFHGAVSIPTLYGILRAEWKDYDSSVPVTVLIPAYNEAANIEATILSVMSGTCMPTQVIAINDGSTDATLSILRRLEADYPNLLVLTRDNSGSKAGALNHALPYVTNEIVVAIDADTIIKSDAIEYLLEHFENPTVGAVAGKVYPATMHSVFAQFQYLEYMQGQNIDKEVFSLANAIGVVPGAIGAWRLSALKTVGGYSNDTVVEDQDLTLALLSLGYTVDFEHRSIAFTETPSTLAGFFKQRSRWVFGTLQCVWKYRSWAFSRERKSLGWIVLPNSLVFNVLMPALIPVVDTILFLSLFGVFDVSTVFIPFLIYTAFDMWYAIEGIARERDASPKLIAMVLWQRFFYRYVIAATVYKALAQAAHGSFVSWGTHIRRGECHTALSSALQAPRELQFIPSPLQLSSLTRVESSVS